MRAFRRLALALLAAAPGAARTADVGRQVEDVELPAPAGGKAHLLSPGTVNVLVFAKPNHPHCLETLRDLASREPSLPGARWVAILPGDTPAADARALAAATGVKMPMVLDVGDALYGRLEIKLQPTILVIDRQGRVAASEPFREINYGDRVTARVRFALGEIGAEELALTEDPARADTHSDQGMALSRTRFGQKLLNMGQLDLALSEAHESLALSPTSAGYLLLARVLTRQGRCDEAGRAFEMARRLEPRNGELLAELKLPCPPRKGTP
jgi:tetratricopeptide (TPR) repeat protein